MLDKIKYFAVGLGVIASIIIVPYLLGLIMFEFTASATQKQNFDDYNTGVFWFSGWLPVVVYFMIYGVYYIGVDVVNFFKKMKQRNE